jgi:chromosome segregation ATPase
MDKEHIESSVGYDTENALAQLLEQQCVRADEFFAGERQRMQEIETELLAHINQLTEQLSQLSDGSQLTADLSAIEQELNRRGESLASAESEFKHAQDELNSVRAELEQRADQLAQTEERLNLTARRLAEDEEALEKEKAATRRQRRRIANQLKERRAELLQDLDQQRQQIEQLQATHGAEDDQALQLLSDQRDALADERDRLQEKLDKLDSKFQQQRSEIDELRQLLAAVDQHSTSDASTQQQADDLQMRLDLAMKEIRELQELNADLQQSVEDVKAEASTGNESPFDWETQKRRLLEWMDGGEAATLSDDEKESLQDKIRVTDEIVTDKDRKIADLQNKLQQQRAVAPPDTAQPAQEDVDRDAAVQEERKSLAKLQEALREKMREAEVEISLERAKLAREKSALQEKICDLETVIEKRLSELRAGSSGNAQGKPASRWRIRLGLDGSDE